MRLIALVLLIACAASFSEFSHLAYFPKDGLKFFLPQTCLSYYSPFTVSHELLEDGGDDLQIALIAQSRMEEIKQWGFFRQYFLTGAALIDFRCMNLAKDSLEHSRESLGFSLTELDNELLSLKAATGAFAAGKALGVLNEAENSRQALESYSAKGDSFGSKFVSFVEKAKQAELGASPRFLVGSASASRGVLVFKKKVTDALASLNQEKDFVWQQAFASFTGAKLAVDKCEAEKLNLVPGFDSGFLVTRPFSFSFNVSSKYFEARNLLDEADGFKSSAEKIFSGKQPGFLSLSIQLYSNSLEASSRSGILAKEAYSSA